MSAPVYAYKNVLYLFNTGKIKKYAVNLLLILVCLKFIPCKKKKRKKGKKKNIKREKRKERKKFILMKND